MPHQSHYDILDVSKGASEKDVREAFKEKVREHPPEQDPEGYKLLREAYDILSNPVARREYDNLSEFGHKIEQLQEEADEILQSEEPDYERAVQLLKQAVVLGPDIGLLRDKLGGCYLSNDNPERALTQFEKAAQLDPTNRAYRLHKGFALKKLERFDEAESVLRALWQEDKEDYESGRALASTLIRKEEFDAALSVLDDTIFADGQEDFEDFFCYYDKLYVYIIIDDEDALQATLNKVQRLAQQPDDKRFASFMLAEMGRQLYDASRFSLAHRFVEAAQRLVPGSNEFDDFAAHLKELRDLEESAREIIEDEEVHEFVKHMVSVTLAGYMRQIEEEERKNRMGEIVDTLPNILRVDPISAEVRDGVRLIKRKHRGLYNINPSLYDFVLDAGPAVIVQRPCPHCDESLTTQKGETGVGECGHCNGTVVYTPTGYSTMGGATSSGRPRSTRTSSSANKAQKQKKASRSGARSEKESLQRGNRSTSRKHSSRAGSVAISLVTLILMGWIVMVVMIGPESKTDANGNDTYSVGEPITDENIAAIVSSPYGSDTLDVASFQQGAQQGQPPSNVIESFIAQHVMAGEAEVRGLEPSEEAVQQQLQQLRQNFADEETLNEILAQQGMTMDEVEEEMRSMMHMQTLQEELLSSVDEVSDEEVQAYLDEQADQISAQHILFRVEEGALDEQRAQVRERAQAVLDSARTGEVDFAELAERHGEDGTAQQGGDLGFFSRGRMVEPFADAAFALEEEGDVTEQLVETQFGFHIIRLTGRRTDDSVDPEQARATLQQERQQEIVMDEVERLMRQANVRVNEQVTGTTLPPNN